MSTKKAFMPELDYSVLEKDFNVFDPSGAIHMDSLPVETDGQGGVGESIDTERSTPLPTQQLEVKDNTPNSNINKKIQQVQKEYNDSFLSLVSGLKEKRRVQQIKKRIEEQEEQNQERVRLDTINHSDVSVMDPHSEPGFYMTYTGQKLIAVARKLNENGFIEEAGMIVNLLKRQANIE